MLALGLGLVVCGWSCAKDPSGVGGKDSDAGATADARQATSSDATSIADAATPSDGGGQGGADAGVLHDAAVPLDAASPPDAVPDAAPGPDANLGIISGGPCISGATGATAYRIRWKNAGNGHAQVVYEKNGLPDTSRDHAAAYGYSIGFTPSFVDPFLGQGGLRLDSSSFVDIELSTAGVSVIHSATLSIYGRSYNTTASGSFHWQTFSGLGAAPTNLVSNAAPYQWYSANMPSAIGPGDNGILLRIKAGPNSNSLVVHRIELCLDAE